MYSKGYSAVIKNAGYENHIEMAAFTIEEKVGPILTASMMNYPAVRVIDLLGSDKAHWNVFVNDSWL